MQTWIEKGMVSSASHLVVHDIHMQVVAVAAVIVVRSSSDTDDASNEVRADISAAVAGDGQGKDHVVFVLRTDGTSHLLELVLREEHGNMYWLGPAVLNSPTRTGKYTEYLFVAIHGPPLLNAEGQLSYTASPRYVA